MIGLQLADPQGTIAVQTTVAAGSNGTAVYAQALTGPKGTWTVDAAAAANLQGLLGLEASPTPGPETAKATFEVQ